MKIVERSLISAPPEKVWPFIVTPELFCRWNDKIISMEARGVFVAGQQFSTSYRLTSQSAKINLKRSARPVNRSCRTFLQVQYAAAQASAPKNFL